MGPIANPRVAFFAVCDRNHFIALAAMISSLRAVGHNEPVYVTDCGLTNDQRRILERHDAEILTPPHGGPPITLKLHGPLTVQPETAVILDADIIVRKPLDDLLDGVPTFFTNDVPRSHSGWAQLGFHDVSRPPYVCAGHFIVSRDLLDPYQAAVERMRELVAADGGLARTPEDPFYWGDQDVLNPLLASLETGSYRVVDEVSYYPFRRNVETARLWHHIQPKPWLVPRPQNVYTREMTRLLYDGAVDVPVSMIPHRLRRGGVGAIVRVWFSGRYRFDQRVRGKLGIRRRLRPKGSRHFSGARR